MASRPIFVPVSTSFMLFEEVFLDFHWNPGFSSVQKKKNIYELHSAADARGYGPVLEVSTKSDEPIGQRLSAFNLKIPTPIGEITIESAFQGSKVFQNGGPYADIYQADSWAAKKDPRLKSSGALIGFEYFGRKWPLEPMTAFYDWLYLTALQPHQEYLKRLFKYGAFSDIEFNPERSINCQARTCAMLVSLIKENALDDVLQSPERFISAAAEANDRRKYAYSRQHGFL